MSARPIIQGFAVVLPFLAMACVMDDTSSELVDLPTSVGGSFGRFAQDHLPLVVDEVERAGYHPGLSDAPDDAYGAPSTSTPRVSRRDLRRGFFFGEASFLVHTHDPGNDSISGTETLYLEFVRIPRDTTWYLLTQDGFPAWHEEYALPSDLQMSIADLFTHRLEVTEHEEMRGS